MSSVNVRNCIRFYQTAEELSANTLMNYCGEIIASHWVSIFSTHRFVTSSNLLWLFFPLLQIRFTLPHQWFSCICYSKFTKAQVFKVIFMTFV